MGMYACMNVINCPYNSMTDKNIIRKVQYGAEYSLHVFRNQTFQTLTIEKTGHYSENETTGNFIGINIHFSKDDKIWWIGVIRCNPFIRLQNRSIIELKSFFDKCYPVLIENTLCFMPESVLFNRTKISVMIQILKNYMNQCALFICRTKIWRSKQTLQSFLPERLVKSH